MSDDRRSFQRFDILSVIEFKLLTGLPRIFYGITRNFSYQGMCMETQCHDFEPGDTIEVTLRHPHNDSIVSVPGNVVWKKEGDKFAHVIGINVNETELDTRLRMLEIMSAAGDVPVDSFLMEKKNDDEREKEEAGAMSRDSGTTEMDTARSETPHIDIEDIDHDDQIEEKQMNEENTLFARQGAAAPADESAAWAAYAEATVVHREAMEPGFNTIESDGPVPFPENIWRKKNWRYALIMLAAVAVVASVFSLTSRNRDDAVEDFVPQPLTSAPVQQEKADLPDLPVGDTGPRDLVVEGLPPAIKPDISDELSSRNIKRKKPVLRRRRPVATRTADENPYYIQIGAWKNEDSADAMLTKIKKYYSDAYTETENNLYKVKVPAKSKSEGERMVKEIKDKLNISSLLVLKK